MRLRPPHGRLASTSVSYVVRRASLRAGVAAAGAHLVPDQVTVAMVRDRLAEDDAQEGFLLDGFPRNVPQAETLKKMLSEWDARLSVVLELVVDEDEVVVAPRHGMYVARRRTSRRRPNGGRTGIGPFVEPTRDAMLGHPGFHAHLVLCDAALPGGSAVKRLPGLEPGPDV